MADDDDKDSKTEDPTEKKLDDAREKGNTAFSKELTISASFLALFLASIFIIPSAISKSFVSLRMNFSSIGDVSLNNGADAAQLIFSSFGNIVLSISPIFAILMFAGLASSVSQNVPSLIAERIRPKLNRISLKSGLKKLFGKHGVREFGKSFLKFSTAGIISFIVFLTEGEAVFNSMMTDALSIPHFTSVVFTKIVGGLLLMTIILGVLDVVWVRRDWIDDLKMSKQDIKDEHKQSEGDPMVKMRTRSLARDRARRRMINQVENATVVIANPTHFSIAMRYNPTEQTAPLVIAKGQDRIALKIREMAEKNEVPIHEDKVLARAMYKVVEVDKELPVEFYAPVAAVIRALSNQERN